MDSVVFKGQDKNKIAQIDMKKLVNPVPKQKRKGMFSSKAANGCQI